jgi:hypothetical protein
MWTVARRMTFYLALCLAFLTAGKTGLGQQYSFRFYGTEDGLTNLAAKMIYQDRVGFLWVGTENGIFRYDGQRFQRYGPDEGLPQDSVSSLGESPDGSLLVGYRTGLYQQKGYRFEKVPLPGNGGFNCYGGIQWDGEGRTLLTTNVGLIIATRKGRVPVLKICACP